MAKRHPDREADLRARLRQDPKVKELVEAHALAEGFHFSVVCAPPVVADALASLVPAEAGKKGGRKYHPVVIDAYAGEHPSPLTFEYLAERVLARLLQGGQDVPPGKTPLYFLDASRMQPADMDAWRALFRRMNETRNRIIRDVDAPVILVLPAEWDVEFAKNAPDLWSVGSYQARLSLAMPLAPEYALEERRPAERERAKGVWGGEDIPKLLKEIEKARKVVKARPGDAAAVKRLLLLLERWGNAERDRGDLGFALQAWRECETVLMTLIRSVEEPPADWHRELSASHINVGDILLDQGDLAGAKQAYQASMELYTRLGESDPADVGWKKMLAVVSNKLGSLLKAQGELAGSFQVYSDGLKISRMLVEDDPDNTELMRGVSIDYGGMGDILYEQGDLSGALQAYRDGFSISKALAESHPTSAELQRDLAICLDRIGMVLRAQGDLVGALQAYQACRDYHAHFVEADPSHTGSRRDLAISLGNIGTVQVKMNKLAEANQSFKDCLELTRGLLAIDHSRPEWLHDAGITSAKLAQIAEASGDILLAVEHFRQARSYLDDAASRSPEYEQFQKGAQAVASDLARLTASRS
jgi:tetratricopeptide (TPR) repeat protein